MICESEAAAYGKGVSAEVAAHAGTKDSRDAHSASLPALRGVGSDFMGL